MNSSQDNRETTQSNKINNDAISVAEACLKQSGGNAKAAFYSLAQQKGVDPNSVIAQINSIGNPSSLISSMISANPNVKRLFSLCNIFR